MMTVCVAVECDGAVAIATDNQFCTDTPSTGSFILGKKESKIIPICDKSCLLVSHNDTHAKFVVRKLTPQQRDGDIHSLSIGFHEAYTKFLADEWERNCLQTQLGMTREQFWEANDPLVCQENFQTWKDKVHPRPTFDALLVGVDEDGTPSIYMGAPFWQKASAGYAAIGIGKMQAETALRLRMHDPKCSASEGLDAACFAKCIAHETVPAIGKETEVCLQTKKALHKIEGEGKGELLRGNGLERLKPSKKHLDSISKIIDELLN